MSDGRIAKTPLWQSIATTLRGEITEGRYPVGAKLPTEAELALRFGVNRHTVRHAIGALVDDGLIVTRRGSGAFVTSRPTDYRIGRRMRFHQSLRDAGQTPERQILNLETGAATPEECRVLSLGQDASVHRLDALSLADGHPICLSFSVFPSEGLEELADVLRDEPSISRALATCGVPDHIRQSTRITARLASPTEALHLRLREGAPLIRTIAVNTDRDGRPIEYGVALFAADRVSLTLED